MEGKYDWNSEKRALVFLLKIYLPEFEAESGDYLGYTVLKIKVIRVHERTICGGKRFSLKNNMCLK